MVLSFSFLVFYATEAGVVPAFFLLSYGLSTSSLPSVFVVLPLTSRSLCSGLVLCVPTPSIAYVGALTPNVTVPGDRTCEKVLRLMRP